MKTRQLVPLKVGDRVSNAIAAKHRRTVQRDTGTVTSVSPLAVRWLHNAEEFAGYERQELHKLPAMRCRCPDCDRSRGRKPCPLQDRVADASNSISGALDAGAVRASHIVMGADAATAVVAHIVRSCASVNVEYQGIGTFKISVDVKHRNLLPISK